MKSTLLILAFTPALRAATISTPNAIEMRHRNPGATNYAANMYAAIPPSGAPGLMLFTGNDSIECVKLGTGLSWTPEDPVAGTHGVLNVTATGVQADWAATTGSAVILNKPSLFDGTWASLTGKPAFATVATSGAYGDLSGTPSLGTAAAQNTSFFAIAAQGTKADTAVQPGSLALVATSGSYPDLINRPTLGTAAATASTDYATVVQGGKADTALQPAAVGVSVQAYSSALGTFASNGSAFYLSRSNHTGTQAASTITGLVTVATTGAYADLTGKPTLGTAAAQNTTAFDAAGAATTAQAFAIQRANHTGTQAISTVTGLQTALDGKFAIPAGTTSQYVRGDGTLATYSGAPTIYRTTGVVAGGAGRVTFSFPSFGAGVVPIVQAIPVKPTAATVSYNCAIYGNPTDTSCTIEATTVNPTILGILGSILVAAPAPNGTVVHLVVMAP